ncbi:MAG: N-glycosylase/DNA lyase [Limisphaerales bacterium]|nr:MAG: N-glycosylase/DNA lyase [Limisphaerales bacterium]KAG0508823.1 MAG: N-glycosylase/DNA lyase [Limisphaerales bacterium]TXT49717.1 MAG: N-glycosylase/DNA lyase [Limisphaerales bacterium]
MRVHSRDSRATKASFPVRDYDLAATLASGQAFRWRPVDEAWKGIVAGRWVCLKQTGDSIRAETAVPQTDWQWLREFLQLDVNLTAVVATFPDDEPMRASVAACRGLRLLRQEPWETLVTFICSSTKQIVQIQQIIALLCERFGQPILVGDDVRSLTSNAERGTGNTERKSETPHVVSYAGRAFPTAARLAACSEAELRACKMGFRAPYVRAAAQAVASGELDLARLHALTTSEARAALMSLHGVGRKIADCVLLFAYGKQDAFPVDVWVRRALKELYFPRRRPSAKRLEKFANSHFGPNAGYAQQYLFHYVRTLRTKE